MRFLTLFSLFAAGSCLAGTIVVPNSFATTNGGFNNNLPFDVLSSRYQQVYAASQFGTSPLLITQLAFRPAPNEPAFGPTTLASVQIDLSTTSAAPGALSTTFANNIGSNNLVVFNGALTLSSTASGPVPKPFDIIIVLTNPFVYDPNAGNLLLDVHNFSGTLTARFDANANSGVMSRAFGTINSATGQTDVLGLITQFQTTAVPEPATIGGIGLGLVLLGLLAGRRRR